VILGSGWAGFQLARDLNKDKFDVTLVSPSNHFLFTPLLPSTTVGTLEYRCIQEPVRTVPGVKFIQAKAKELNFCDRTLKCRDIFDADRSASSGTAPNFFDVGFDQLVVGVGCKTNTFNTPGVAEREGREVFFLKHLFHARQIRNRVLECFERASVPGVSNEERARLLHFVVVGGGPTSVEFTAELHDFLKQDLKRVYPDLTMYTRITLVESSANLLGTFAQSLRDYTRSSLEKRQVEVLTGTAVKAVTYVHPPAWVGDCTTAHLSNGAQLLFGTMVWSAGLAPVKFSESLEVEKGRAGRIVIDGTCRVPGLHGVWAMGDCAINPGRPCPPTAQVAQQQAKYIAKALNSGSTSKPFEFLSLGAMSQLGFGKGVLDLTSAGTQDGPHLPEKIGTVSGFVAFASWRFAYWGKQVSLVNKIQIPMYWFKAFFFGRDISRF